MRRLERYRGNKTTEVFAIFAGGCCSFEMEASHLRCFNVPVAENFRKCTGGYIGNGINGKGFADETI